MAACCSERSTYQRGGSLVSSLATQPGATQFTRIGALGASGPLPHGAQCGGNGRVRQGSEVVGAKGEPAHVTLGLADGADRQDELLQLLFVDRQGMGRQSVALLLQDH